MFKKCPSRRKHIVSAFCCLAGIFTSGPSIVAASEKPNIILILADDLGYADLGCQGSNEIITPATDRLAASGIRYTAGYVTAPQCGPSRAGL